MKLELKLTPRDYQIAVVSQISLGWAAGHKRQILAMATGSGKTATGASLIQRVLAADILPPNTLPYFICDKTTLIRQTADNFEAWGLNCAILQADNTTPRTGREHVVIASIATIRARYKVAPDDMGMMIVDECHGLSKHQRKIFESLNALMAVGLTATPLRPGLGQI
jgi:type I restriction enzyme R subunit